MGSALGTFPLILFFSFFFGEEPNAYNALFNNEFQGPFGESYGPILIVCLFSLIYCLRPYFLNKLIFETSPFYYFSMNMICTFFILMCSVIFVEIQGNMSSTKNIALLTSAFAYFVYYNASIELIRKQEIESSIELLKSTLPLDADIGELNKIEN